MNTTNPIPTHSTPLPLPPLMLKAKVKRCVLPDFDNANTLLTNTQLSVPREIVQGLLHKGTKGIIASTSKAGKTWLLLDLAISVATGSKFLKWDTKQGRVLFVNFEIQRTFIRERVQTIMTKKRLTDLQGLDMRFWLT